MDDSAALAPKNQHRSIQTLDREIPVLPDGSHPIALGSGTITSVLGEGGVAVVYEIWNNKLGISRAVKLLKPNATVESEGRFESEMRITAQLRHPNIVEIHSVGDWHGLPYIEMEKVDGFPLDKVIRERGSLPPDICAAIGIIICRALTFMHGHVYLVNDQRHVGILHRDLKPSNIMISTAGVVKLMDFGIATPTGASLHTMEGTVVGSLQYLAPELLEATHRPDSRSDLFSLGCVLYEMVTGVRAFTEKNMAKLINSRMKNNFRPLSEFKVKCPRELARLINACLTKDPEKRIKSASEACSRLEKIYSRLSKKRPEELVAAFVNVSRTKTTVGFKYRPPLAMIIGAAAVLVLCAAGVLIAFSRENYRRASISAPTIKTTLVNTPSIAQPAPVPTTPQVQQQPVKKTEKTPGQTTMTPTDMRSQAITQLEKKYHTQDRLTILAGEVSAQNFKTALTVFDGLPTAAQSSTSARIYRMRAVLGLGDRTETERLFSQSDIPDREYYIAKAKFASSMKRFEEAVALCEKGLQVSASLGDADELARIAAYVKASSLSRIFETAPSDEIRKKALDSWFEVKYLLRNNQTHQYFSAANTNIRLLSDASKNPGL